LFGTSSLASGLLLPREAQRPFDVGGLAANKAVVDESAAPAAVTEVTAE